MGNYTGFITVYYSILIKNRIYLYIIKTINLNMEKQYNLQQIKKEAVSFLEIKKQINENTFKNYRSSLTYFLNYLESEEHIFLNSNNVSNVLESFQGKLLNGFKYENKTIVLTANSVNTHIRRINTFLRKCLGLTTEIKKLNVSKPKYKSLKVAEIKLLIDEAENHFKNNEVAERNKTLINFLFNTAFRIEEALNIKTTDLYSEDGSYMVNIHEKGKAKGEYTTIAISEKTFQLIQNYLELKKVPSEFVFSTGSGKKLARANFNKAIRELATYVDLKHGTNISKTVENNSSHVFRHSKATYLLNVKKEDVVTVKEILRHKSIDSTLIYLNPQEEAINKVRINNDL